ncbi:porin [Sphingomonas naphthae]|uniref:Porin n=1 Tax=Sphingomonas naphthae TaxID=1813468 RepID=A0ABY7TSW3_9SPHN|nr:porin [Sphingomonas naphthae]WCT75314.1 porin [Sphingomonas naphthae]
MSKVTLRACLVAGVSVIAGSIGSAAHAGAFYLQEQSTKGAGRAFSGEVADKGPESLWWNPAAIGGMTGGAAYVGASAILPKGDVDNINTRIIRPGQAPAAVGGQQSSADPINKGVVPSGAIAYGLTPQIAVGLAVTAPYNFTTNYDSDSWARYTADKSHLRTIDIQPSVAFTPTPGVSIGAALNIEQTKASLSNFLPNLSPLLADGHQTLKGDGWDLGWSAGAQFSNGPFTLGASYKSSIKHKLGGTVTTAGLLGPLAAQNRVIDTDATFRTPWQATVGARVAVTPAVTLNAQVVRVGWGKFDAIRLGAPLNTAIPENYRNTWSFAGGVDYMVSPQWTLRAGVQHDQTPTRDGERDARVPDADRWNFAGGASYQMSKAIAIDAAVNYIHFKDATIDRTTAAYAGTAVQTPILVSGQLRSASAVVLSLGARASF